MEVNTRFATVNVFIHSTCNYIYDNPINYLNVKQIHRNYITFPSLTSSTRYIVIACRDVFGRFYSRISNRCFLSLSHIPRFSSPSNPLGQTRKPRVDRNIWTDSQATRFLSFIHSRFSRKKPTEIELESEYLRIFADRSPRIRGTKPKTRQLHEAVLDSRF